MAVICRAKTPGITPAATLRAQRCASARPSPQKMQVVELNVGGYLFTTTRTTLCRDSNSMLAKMFSEDSELPPAYRDSQGRFFIDRDGKYFHIILSYLREQHFDLPNKRSDREALAEEGQFFQLTGFLDHIALPAASYAGPNNAGAISLDRLAASTYEEGHAMVIAHARDCLGHNRVQTICNAIVKSYFCQGMIYDPTGRLPRGPLITLHHRHDQSLRVLVDASYAVTSLYKPVFDAPGINDQDLLRVVADHAGLFKHDLALRGFNLEVLFNRPSPTLNHHSPATGLRVSAL